LLSVPSSLSSLKKASAVKENQEAEPDAPTRNPTSDILSAIHMYKDLSEMIEERIHLKEIEEEEEDVKRVKVESEN
jgi:hypothetical protein